MILPLLTLVGLVALLPSSIAEDVPLDENLRDLGFLTGNGPRAGKNGPPEWANLPPAVRSKFQADNTLKSDYDDFELQLIGNGQLLKTKCSNAPIKLDNLTPSNNVAGTTCLKDGVETDCPAVNVFTKMDGSNKVTVSKHPDGSISSIQVVGPDCGAETFQEVTPGLVTSIPSEALDEEALSKFFYGDVDLLRRRTRNLRVTSSTSKPEKSHRNLQTCPSKSINLAVAFDSSFCVKSGGYTDAIADIQTTVSGVAALYEATTCLTVSLGYVEGYCTPSSDPYKPGVDTNKSGCGDYGILDFVQNYWNANRQSVDRDLMQFASGTGLECNSQGCVIGCAYVKVMCTSPGGSYGVNYLTFTGNQALRASLLAHEMGHNVGSRHDSSSNSGGVDLGSVNYIMEPYINSGSNGFSPYSQGEFTSQPQWCLDNVASGPTAPPPTFPPTTPPPTFPPTTPPPTPKPTTCPLAPVGGSCSSDGHCCSNKCRGKPGRKKCKNA